MDNKKNINSRKKISNGGYTLVELLAMVSLLSIISVIVIYTSTAVVEKANNKSYMVTINNIQKEAETYVLENNNIFWLTDGSDYLYQCITIQNLIDKGYFDNNILNSKIDKNKNISSTDYVYIEKNRSTKTITRSVLLYNNPQLNGLCGVDTLADGIIEFNIPSGFAKSKEITITYTLKSSIGSASNYKYSYGFDADNSSDKDIGEQSFNFNTKNKIVKKIIVNDNGWVFAKIDKLDNTNINNSNIYVDGVDTNGPVITSNATSATVRGSVVIPVIINDIGSGIKGDSINLSEFKVSIGNKILTENFSFEKVSSNINTYNYNLKIENYNYEGEVKIVIDKDRILDNLGNGNVDTVISTGVIFSNKYTISYNSTGGTGIMNSTICTYGNTCTLSTNIFTKTGYTFLGWSTSSGSNTVVYNDKYVFNVFDNKDDVHLYAVWRANTYTIKYSANGGSGTMSDTSCTYDSNCTLRINSFTRTGYTFNGWNTKSDGSGTSYTNSQAVKNLVSSANGSITLYAKWKVNTYTIKYSANGGSGTMSDTSCTYDSNCTLRTNSFTRTGYTFNGWNTKSDGSGTSYTNSQAVKNLVSSNNGSITLYAKWKSSNNICTVGTTYENCLLNENRPSSLWTSTLTNDGYRFVGTKSSPPNNYICFGTTSSSTCTGSPDTYMYRIIGIFQEGGTKYLKLIKNTRLGGYPAIDDNFNSDNRWSITTLYSSINGSGFLNNTTYVPNSTWKNKIISRTWVSADTDLNGYNSSGVRLWTLTPAQIYCFEHNISSCKPSGGVYTSSSAKIGLMYVSDYALSLGSSAATTSSSMEGYKSTLKTGWMYNYTNFSNSVSGVIEWTMTRGGYPVTGLTNARFYGIRLDGYSLAAENRYGAEHRPVFYMSASQKYAGGLGTASKPFIIVE